MAKRDLAAIILAAGEASRFRKAAGDAAPATKLVARHRGKALVRHVAETALAAGLAPVVVVTGHARESILDALEGLDLTTAHNPDYATGMASSLKQGLRHLAPEVRGVVVLLGDMPLVSPALVTRLADAFDQNPQADAVVPVFQGERGNPVLLSARLIPDLMTLGGDAGARQVLRGRDAGVIEVAVDEAAARLDVDTPEALDELGRDPSSGTHPT